ncbi:serine/threonine protein kinase [Ktedonosporobacter rubrisoli]|nr:serine/threonine-protein kinase [Ktedonosporobacter rubrisoli]
MSDRTGQRLDNYRLIRLLGFGSFGEVYLAEHIYHKNIVAIKVLQQLTDSELPGFLNEARTIRLKHPHIVQVLDFGVDHRIAFIVMDYAPNGTLRQRHPKGTQVPLETVVLYIKQIASALQYAHSEHVIHRDVKPENLLLGPNDEVLVSDFGIAMIARSARSQSLLEMAGTIAYMAPEQLQGRPQIASDQYALGIIAYEWLCGERPFNGTAIEVATQHVLTAPSPLHIKIPSISSDIEQVVLSALAKDPQSRFPDVQSFAIALEQAYNSQFHQPELTSSFPLNKMRPPLSIPSISLEQNVASTLPISARPLQTSISNIPQPSTANFNIGAPAIEEPTPSIVNNPISRVNQIPLLLAFSKSAQLLSQRKFNIHLKYFLLLVILIVSLLGATFFYLLHSNQQLPLNITNIEKDATLHIDQARKALPNDPSTALRQLSQAQLDLKHLQGISLNSEQLRQFSDLQSKFVSITKTAITSYNQQGAIVPLAAAGPCVNVTNSPLDSGTTETQANILAVIQNEKYKQFFYAVGTDQKLYRLNDQRSLVNKISAVQDVLVQAVVSDGQRLVALASRPEDNSYALHLLLPNDDGTLKDAGTATVDQKYMQNDLVPQFVAAWGQDVYVILTSKTAPNTADMIHYKISGDNQWEKATPVNATLSISNTLVSVAAFPDGRLFLLYSNGIVQTLPFANGGNLTPIGVVIQSTIPVPLSATAADFSPTSAVPTPGTQGVQAKSFLSVPGASMLATGLIDSDNAPHLFILDKDHFRVIDLKVAQEAAMTATVTPSASPTSSTGNGNGGTGGGTVSTGSGTQLSMTLVRQYTSANLLAVMKSAVADPRGTSLYLLTQSAQSNATPGLISIDMHQQNDQQSACASS